MLTEAPELPSWYRAFSPAQARVDIPRPRIRTKMTSTGTITGEGMRLTRRARTVQQMAARRAQAKVAPGAKVQIEE